MAAATEDAWGDEGDESLFPPPPDDDDLAELEPEPEPEPPEIAQATASCSSDADLEACLRVLRSLTNEKEVFLNSRRFRDVRASVMQLSKVMNEKMYDGKTAAEYIEWSVKAQIERAAKDRLRRRDADKVEKTQLRAARLQRLAELQGQQGADGLLALSAVPDGAVETGDASAGGAAMLAAGVGAQSSFAVKAGRRTLAAGVLAEALPEDLECASCDDDQTGADAGKEKEEEEGQLLHQERRCYQCKSWFRKLHHFYAQLCPQCAALNWTKRHQAVDMHGRVALVTGGRVKIGYHVALKLLRCGATTIVTSRFPADAARRFAVGN
jgi:3-oxoacyl-ACP reductase-like protein